MAIVLETLRPAPLDPAAEQVMAPMRDGVRLATDVYLPARPGRLPAVLVRLPYDKCGRYTFMPQCAPHFTERGYAFVVQDVRGKFRSEGETMAFVHEVDDHNRWRGRVEASQVIERGHKHLRPPSRDLLACEAKARTRVPSGDLTKRKRRPSANPATAPR